MRLHLVIQRHGLPVTRILWTTAPPSLFGQNASRSAAVIPAPSSAIASTRTPNALYANGGYTIAQLLEDVNGVIPLETEPALFDNEFSGQWGLEDYVVEVEGSECLHFMDVEGLLRDGDEVLIRALQISDLRARRLSGRHQISADGRHLIDGIPFGKPFLKRPTSSRPAITIPPRKKRRTNLTGWGNGVGYEDEDTEWAPPARIRSVKEISALENDSNKGDTYDKDEYEDAYQDDYEDFHQANEDTGEGTVIRYNVNDAEDDQVSESDADISDFDAGDLTEELKDLKEDMEVPAMSAIESTEDAQAEHGSYPLRTRSSLHTAPRSSLSQTIDRKHPDVDLSRRDSKSVRFQGQKEKPPVPPSQNSPVIKTAPTPALEKGSIASESSSSSSASESSDTSSEEDSSSSSEESSESETDQSTSDSEDSTTSESEEEASDTSSKANPPGKGSLRTKKSNQRNKMRRRLAKLKELGALPAEADFAALRKLEETLGGLHYFPTGTKEDEQAEFEAKRQKLLRDLESGGIDVTEKQNVPLGDVDDSVPALPEQEQTTPTENANQTGTGIKRRTLDVASTRRLLFGSLGVRTPRTKEDEEATRKRLAGKANNFLPRKTTAEEPVEIYKSDSEENWQDKLIVRATECIFDDVELSAPPFPFEQRWDMEAIDIIRQRKGLGKKRKRRQRLPIYDGEDEAEFDNGNYNDEGDLPLNYDDTEQPNHDVGGAEKSEQDGFDGDANDLPHVPNDLGSLEMSKDTNWQPAVSGYRVSEIHDVFDGNILRIRLAKRNRRQPRIVDEGEEEPQYSGFEMPGFEEEEAEDDGFREVSFSDLIDPKLLRAADAAGLGEAEKASFSLAEPLERSPKPDAQDAEIAPPDSQQLTQKEPEQLTKDAVDAEKASGEDSSFGVKSPEFHGFQSSDEESVSACRDSSGADHNAKGNEEEEEDDDDHGSGNRTPDPRAHPPSTSQSTAPPNRLSYEASAGLDRDLEMMSSPEGAVSFNNLLSKLFQGKDIGDGTSRQESIKDKDPDRPPSRSSLCSVVPNPFYEIDRAHEEHRRQSSRIAKSTGTKDADSTMDYLSAAEFPSSPTSHKSPTREKPPPSASQEASLINTLPESILEERAEVKEGAPPASQMSAVVVDLTQSSPLVSPEGSDKEYITSHRLPRGQRNAPGDRRQTRRSSVRVQTLKEVSISPPMSRRRGRSRMR
ncbi:hypothetical protein EYZ11_001785 [Aspergillus tanneri]|uniref:DUF7357 domain-containing protein n=1 Tax=Aspergillus tanneri TaxID=1220188 RepID=A0A4S3JSH4_9EURO|nr:hypothetical protein EYZ11_001785 [Aspergillus tanneri]